MILEQETFEKFGYHTSQLKKGSHKPVVRKCDTCGDIGYPRFIRITPYCRGCGVSANSVNIAAAARKRLKKFWNDKDIRFTTYHPALNPLVKKQTVKAKRPKKVNIERPFKLPRINKKCPHCATEKLIEDFSWRDKSKKGRRQSWCKDCHAAHDKVYSKTPKRKASLAAYAKTPKGMEVRVKSAKTHEQTPKRKASKVVYANIPEVKAMAVARAQTPKYKTVKMIYRKSPHGKAIRVALGAKRRAAKLHRTPPWSEEEAIKQFIINCPEGMVVDHDIPLQGKLVSGLHVLSNLRYLTKSENSKKRNKFDPIKFNNLSSIVKKRE
jgi:hypothetical protein